MIWFLYCNVLCVLSLGQSSFGLPTDTKCPREPACAAGAGAPGSAWQRPEGLSASDWSSIRAAYEANRHAAFAIEGGYQAPNPGQKWQTRFDGRGFVTTPDDGDWSW